MLTDLTRAAELKGLIFYSKVRVNSKKGTGGGTQEEEFKLLLKIET